MLLDQQQLASALNVTTRTIRAWHTEGCPIHSQEVHCTLYNLPDVLEFVVKKRVGNELTYEKTRLTAAMATKTELETKRLQQELLQTNLVNITWGMFLSDLEDKVRAIPEQLSEDLLQQETMLDCKTMLKEIFSEALADLSRMEAMTK
jgi:phage terminase Nu1 subunit (DNA packaging protein)